MKFIVFGIQLKIQHGAGPDVKHGHGEPEQQRRQVGKAAITGRNTNCCFLLSGASFTWG